MIFRNISNVPFEESPSLIVDKISNKGKNFSAFIGIDLDRNQKNRNRLSPSLIVNNYNLSSYKEAIRYRNEQCLPQLRKIENDDIGVMPVESYDELKGGVKKRFSPKHAVVIAAHKKTAIGDYKKEDDASERLRVTYPENPPNPDRGISFFSFQESIDEDMLNQIRLQEFLEANVASPYVKKDLTLSQARRVSVYGQFDNSTFKNPDGNPDEVSDQYYTTLEKIDVLLIMCLSKNNHTTLAC